MSSFPLQLKNTHDFFSSVVSTATERYYIHFKSNDSPDGRAFSSLSESEDRQVNPSNEMMFPRSVSIVTQIRLYPLYGEA